MENEHHEMEDIDGMMTKETVQNEEKQINEFIDNHHANDIMEQDSNETVETFESEHQPLLPPISDLLFDDEEDKENAKDIHKTFNRDSSVLMDRAEFIMEPRVTNINKASDKRPMPQYPTSSNLDLLAPVVVCDDLETLCPGGSCCASSTKQSGYGCCPYISGTCCSNQMQCCPDGYECVDFENSIRDKIYRFFGFTPNGPEVRCRFNLSSWVKRNLPFADSTRQIR